MSNLANKIVLSSGGAGATGGGYASEFTSTTGTPIIINTIEEAPSWMPANRQGKLYMTGKIGPYYQSNPAYYSLYFAAMDLSDGSMSDYFSVYDNMGAGGAWFLDSRAAILDNITNDPKITVAGVVSGYNQGFQRKYVYDNTFVHDRGSNYGISTSFAFDIAFATAQEPTVARTSSSDYYIAGTDLFSGDYQGTMMKMSYTGSRQWCEKASYIHAKNDNLVAVRSCTQNSPVSVVTWNQNTEWGYWALNASGSNQGAIKAVMNGSYCANQRAYNVGHKTTDIDLAKGTQGHLYTSGRFVGASGFNNSKQFGFIGVANCNNGLQYVSSMGYYASDIDISINSLRLSPDKNYLWCSGNYTDGVNPTQALFMKIDSTTLALELAVGVTAQSGTADCYGVHLIELANGNICFHIDNTHLTDGNVNLVISQDTLGDFGDYTFEDLTNQISTQSNLYSLQSISLGSQQGQAYTVNTTGSNGGGVDLSKNVITLQ